MRTWLILSCMLCSTASLAVPVWTWVDETGRQHFSDRPAPGARPIELGSAPVISLRTPLMPTAAGSAPEVTDSQAAESAYTAFAIASPADGQTLWNTEGRLEVVVELTPPLQPGHRLDIELDGRRIELGGAGPTLTVPDVYRGLHTLNAVILNERDEEVLRSPGVTFAVQQTSILNPNNPQNRR